MHMKKYLILSLICLIFSEISAQLIIHNPLNNAVYQRNASDQANLTINGTYSEAVVTAIQARLLNPDNNTPISGFDWRIIQNNPSKGTFSGNLQNVPAGWYILQVRVLRSGLVLQTAQINRVGIGDVFMIAGQSNAQGWFNGNGPSADEEKVVTHDFNMYCRNEIIPFPIFSKIEDYTKTSIGGRDAWLYGKLGDNIVTTTGYPVAFFNGAASGSKIQNWTESINNLPTTHPFTLNQFCFLQEENNIEPAPSDPTPFYGLPYRNLKYGLNYYNSIFGARSVLWHQGESDNVTVTPSRTLVAYQSGLQTLINQTRTDYASNLPWVISRASFINNSSDAVILAAQAGMVNNTNQIFLGPETDDLNNNNFNPDVRDTPNVHFKDQGLIEVANRWSNHLNASFFSTSVPISPNPIPAISAAVVNGNQVQMSVPNTYSTYKWVEADGNGLFGFGNTPQGTSHTLTRSSGIYRCWVVAANGNLQISAPVDVSKVLNYTNNSMVCSQNVFLSDLKYFDASNSLGPIELDKTNGNAGDGDGQAIVLKGISYPKGLGVAGNSEINFRIPSNQFFRIQAKLGIGDEVAGTCNNTGGVVYKVFGDNNLLYTSSVIYRNSALVNLDVVILNRENIRLVVEEVNGNLTCNRAVWADLKLLCIAADNEPPTAPTNLVVLDTLTMCLNFQWTASQDNLGVTGYRIFKNGILQKTIAANTLSYTLTGLTPDANVTIGIQAIDANQNLSDTTKLVVKTISGAVDYGNLSDFICQGQTYFPISQLPNGGTFQLGAGGTDNLATLNSSTGAYFSNGLGFNVIIFTYSHPDSSVCDFTGSTSIGTVAPPNTPIVNVDKNLVNKNTIVNLNSTACITGVLGWNFTNSTSINVQHTPDTTFSYRSFCRVNQCYRYSNFVEVKVLNDCYSNLSLTNPSNNLGSRINPLVYNSSNTITASNQVVPNNNLTYNAAQSILLQPGFSIQPGVIFTAKVQACPD